jgi:hypothetical protein
MRHYNTHRFIGGRSGGTTCTVRSQPESGKKKKKKKKKKTPKRGTVGKGVRRGEKKKEEKKRRKKKKEIVQDKQPNNKITNKIIPCVRDAVALSLAAE